MRGTERAETTAACLLRQASQQADTLAYRFLADGSCDGEQQTLTYQGLLTRSQAIACWLQREAHPGDRVVLLYAPGLDFIEGFFGCQLGGVIAVPAYPPDLSRLERSLPRLRAIVRDCQARIVLTTSALLGLSEHFFSLCPELSEARWIATDELPSKLSLGWQNQPPRPKDCSFLQYTSGSTGEAKGVIITHENLFANALLSQEIAQLQEPMRMVSWLPPYHDMGLIGALLLPLYTGGHCTFFSPLDFLRRPLLWLQAVSRFRANISGAPNFAYELTARKVKEEEKEGLDLSAWRMAPNGSEIVRAETAARFCQAFARCGFQPRALCAGYGLAETTLTITGDPNSEGIRATTFDQDALALGRAIPNADGHRLVSCGKPWGDMRLRIVDPVSRRGLPDGAVGEIWTQGSCVAPGYWRKPELTKEIFEARRSDVEEGPFLRTGDLGFLYDGALYISGRQKDLVVIRGRNYYPADLEPTIERAHPAVRPGCVAAFSVEHSGAEALGVLVELDPRSTAKPDEVISAIREALLTAHHLPVSSLWLTSPGSIPKTSSGKIQRYACREGAQQGTLDVISAWHASTTNHPPTPPAQEAHPTQAHAASAQQLERFLCDWLASVDGVTASALGPQTSLARCGLDSVNAIELIHALEQLLGHTLQPSLLWSHPTIAALAAHLANEQPPAPSAALAVSPAAPRDEYPLWFSERDLFNLLERSPQPEIYNLFIPARISGPLRVDALKDALQALLLRQENLRVAFPIVDKVRVRRIAPALELSLPVEDLSALSEEQRALALQRASDELSRRRFDLTEAPLFAARLLLCHQEESFLFVSMSHLLIDAWGLLVMRNELTTLYQAALHGTEARLAPLTLQMRDYAVAAEEHLQKTLAPTGGLYPPYQEVGYRFPYDRPHPETLAAESAWHPVALETSLQRALEASMKAAGSSLSAACLVAFQVALHRLSQREQVEFTTINANRRIHPMRAVIGYMVYSELFQSDLSGDPDYLSLLSSAMRFAVEERPTPPRPFLDRPRSMRIVFNLQNLTSAQLAASPFSLAPEHHAARYLWEICDLDFGVTLLGRELQCGLRYRREVIDESTARRLASLFVQSLQELAQNPAQRPLR